MKTISVKQVAAALDITPRAVIYRLEKKQLRGTQSPNAFGKQEWRVYPTKEIIDGLKRNSAAVEQARKESPQPTDFDFTPDDIDIVDVYEESSERGSEEDSDSAPGVGPRDWQDMARETVKSMAEELVRPLGELIRQQQEQLAEQQAQIAERDQLIEEKNRQLRLLPDFQKQAEEERKAAELKELEAEALRKQIAALRVHQEEKAKQEIEELQLTLAASQQTANEEIQRLKEEKEASNKTIEELRAAEELKLAEKEAEAKAIREQLAALSATVEELRMPWWKKWFTSGDAQ